MRHLDMKSTFLSFVTAAIVATQPHAHAVLGVGDIVSDPIAEEALIHKNIFDKLKYAWEQAQWADKLATPARHANHGAAASGNSQHGQAGYRRSCRSHCINR